MRLYLTIAFFVLCCKTPVKKNTTDLLVEQLVQLSGKDIGRYQAIFFVPSEGCGGCINNAENFMLHTYIENGKKGILFVVTGHSSQKSARIRLGEAVMQNTDVFFDYKHNFDKPPFMNEFPKLILLKKGGIISEIEVNPTTSEDAYKELGKIITNAS
jgi:hypothetical protein